MSDEAIRRALTYLNRRVGVELLFAGLSADARNDLYELFKQWQADGTAKHDHPRRPRCWSCGGLENRLLFAQQGRPGDRDYVPGEQTYHAATCSALVATALACMNDAEWDRALGWRPRDFDPRRAWCAVLEQARAAGVNVKAIRPDRRALLMATDEEPPE